MKISTFQILRLLLGNFENPHTHNFAITVVSEMANRIFFKFYYIADLCFGQIEK